MRDLCAIFDGLVLSGGSDVSPRHYKEEPLRPEWAGDYVRDLYEMELVREFMALKKPILGVCRGAQILNVFFGGSLYQDITLQVSGSLVHRNWDIYDQNFHDIEIAPGSGLSTLYPGVKRSKVNSIHHQGLRDIGKGLTVEARSSLDQTVEAIRYEGDSYVFGVQWHPEFQDPQDQSLLSSTPVLKEFLQAAIKTKEISL